MEQRIEGCDLLMPRCMGRILLYALRATQDA